MFAVTTMKLCRENPDSDDAKDDNRCDHINHREDDGDNDADDEDEDDGGGGDDDEWVFECCSSAQGSKKSFVNSLALTLMPAASLQPGSGTQDEIDGNGAPVTGWVVQWPVAESVVP
ncbi:hypothetical protein AK812_SmicGene3364 [Symbiodinium microadriaticum]|uniref:Uncharacterized protein n=1 Tax=Symbiodinium microadriaticum TaxID=2951 RepID=A0A1Q9EZA1_SYMMI|nr:hypothetical protein AK812_SmicGene3364 [Symbiodinium microadriaticum]